MRLRVLDKKLGFHRLLVLMLAVLLPTGCIYTGGSRYRDADQEKSIQFTVPDQNGETPDNQPPEEEPQEEVAEVCSQSHQLETADARLVCGEKLDEANLFNVLNLSYTVNEDMVKDGTLSANITYFGLPLYSTGTIEFDFPVDSEVCIHFLVKDPNGGPSYRIRKKDDPTETIYGCLMVNSDNNQIYTEKYVIQATSRKKLKITGYFFANQIEIVLKKNNEKYLNKNFSEINYITLPLDVRY